MATIECTNSSSSFQIRRFEKSCSRALIYFTLTCNDQESLLCKMSCAITFLRLWNKECCYYIFLRTCSLITAAAHVAEYLSCLLINCFVHFEIFQFLSGIIKIDSSVISENCMKKSTLEYCIVIFKHFAFHGC